MNRKTVSSITDDELSFLYDLLSVRYPVKDVSSFVATFEVPLAQPKERHRTVAGRSYTPQRTKDAEEAIGWAFHTAARLHVMDSSTRYGVCITVAGANAASDVDNLAKTVLDGLQGVAYKNDRQVDELHVRRIPGREKFTKVTVYRIAGAS